MFHPNPPNKQTNKQANNNHQKMMLLRVFFTPSPQKAPKKAFHLVGWVASPQALTPKLTSGEELEQQELSKLERWKHWLVGLLVLRGVYVDVFFLGEGNKKLSSTRKLKVPCCCLFQSKESMARPSLSTILVRPAVGFQTLF